MKLCTNVLELKVVRLASQALVKEVVPHHSFLVQMDNKTAVPYVNKMGGTKSIKLCEEALMFSTRELDLRALYIRGHTNKIADVERS